MAYKGKSQITIVFTATPDLVGEGDRIFESHAKWIEETHSREGEKGPTTPRGIIGVYLAFDLPALNTMH